MRSHLGQTSDEPFSRAAPPNYPPPPVPHEYNNNGTSALQEGGDQHEHGAIQHEHINKSGSGLSGGDMDTKSGVTDPEEGGFNQRLSGEGLTSSRESGSRVLVGQHRLSGEGLTSSRESGSRWREARDDPNRPSSEGEGARDHGRITGDSTPSRSEGIDAEVIHSVKVLMPPTSSRRTTDSED